MSDSRVMPATDPVARGSVEAVLGFAFGVEAFTASDAIAGTTLTRSTVLSACAELTRLGWLTELQDARSAGEYRIGRPARRYVLSADAGIVVGVDAGEHTITAMVADLRGVVLARAESTTRANGRDVEQRTSTITSTIGRALAELGDDAPPVLATTIGLPAPVDAGGRSPVDEDGYWIQMNPGYSQTLHGFGQVIVDNDANLAASAEQTIGDCSDVVSFAVLLAGTRLGAGLVVDGRPLRGSHGAAGELRALALVEGVGSADGLGHVAEEEARRAMNDWAVAADSPLAATAHPSARDVFAAARRGDETADAILDRLAARMARICILLGSLLDLDRVVIAGAISDDLAALIPRAQAVLRELDLLPNPEIRVSGLGADVVVRGAVVSALQAVQSDPLTYQPGLARA